MFRSIKVSVTLGAAVLIAAPGCCLPNLLCNHSSPSEETVVTDYSSQYVEDYSAPSADCGCSSGGCSGGGCAIDAGMADTGFVDPGYAETQVVDGQYIIGTPQEPSATIVQGSSTSSFEPTRAESSTSGGSGLKVQDIVKPPADLKSPIENSLPGNLLP